jgi:shikimate dehydrogenase
VTKTARAAVIGDPIAHSLSPSLFAYYARVMKSPLEYSAIRVASPELEGKVAELRREGFAGLNVTRPHKQSVVGLCDWLDAPARLCGAANTLAFAENKITGHNTDVPGLLDALKHAGFGPRNATAVVFGAGGAARAAVYALASKEAKAVRICARNLEKAVRLAAEFRNFFPDVDISAGQRRPADAWINCTPLGWNDGDPSPAEGCEAGLAYDMVYGRKTAFLRQALDAGAKAFGGEYMLAAQAARAWELWFSPLGAPRRIGLVLGALEAVKWA